MNISDVVLHVVLQSLNLSAPLQHHRRRHSLIGVGDILCGAADGRTFGDDVDLRRVSVV